MTSDPPEQSTVRPFRSVAWVLGLALLILAVIVTWHLTTLLRSERQPVIGDGKQVQTYGFELDPCLVSPEEIVAAGLPKDGLPALVLPSLLTVEQVDSLNRAERGKYLVPTDRVVGVSLDGVARCYPIRLLNWHEVVNDTLAGYPIAVTFNPLCESSVVFLRQVAGDTLVFGVSGLLLNSNLLMYDRRSGGQAESLWSQLQARAVAGPAAAHGTVLEILPCAVVTWQTWKSWFPATLVPFPEQEYRERYKRNPYGVYHGSDKLHFPVQPLPTEPLPGHESVRLKERVVVVKAGDIWQVYPLADLVVQAGSGGEWLTTQNGMPLRFVCGAQPAELAVFPGATEQDEGFPTIHSFWFAWYALRAHEPG